MQFSLSKKRTKKGLDNSLTDPAPLLEMHSTNTMMISMALIFIMTLFIGENFDLRFLFLTGQCLIVVKDIGFHFFFFPWFFHY